MPKYSKPHMAIQKAHERINRAMSKARDSMADVPIGHARVDPRTYAKYTGLGLDGKLYRIQQDVQERKKEEERAQSPRDDYDERQKPIGDVTRRGDVGIQTGSSATGLGADGPIIFGAD